MWYNGFFTINIGLGEKTTSKKLNQMKNNIVFQNEFARNLQDALQRYDVTGLPDTCSKRVFMQSLLYYGFTFLYEKNGSLLNLPGMPDGSGINMLGDFGGAYVYGANGYNEHIKIAIPGAEDSALLAKTIGGSTVSKQGFMLRENPIIFPFINQVIYYSERQADTLRKIETATRNAASPYIVTAEESVVPSVKAFFQKRDNNEEYIVSSGVFPADRISLLPFEISSDAIKTMTETYDWYCNHFRELCGVNNTTNIDKKGENLLNAEVNVNNEYTSNQDSGIIEYMNEQLDMANRMFGTNIRIVEVDNGDNDISDVQGESPESVSNDDSRRPADDN